MKQRQAYADMKTTLRQDYVVNKVGDELLRGKAERIEIFSVNPSI
ncbi:MAG: hypothetical protein AAF519_07065 [Bacteroidota bacterium]